MTHHCWLWKWKGAMSQVRKASSRSWEWPSADRQQEDADFSPTATCNGNSAINLNKFEEDLSPEPPERNLVLPAPWFWPCEILSREPAESHCVWTSFWYKKVWNNKFVLFWASKFVAIFYSSNRKLRVSQTLAHFLSASIW